MVKQNIHPIVILEHFTEATHFALQAIQNEFCCDKKKHHQFGTSFDLLKSIAQTTLSTKYMERLSSLMSTLIAEAVYYLHTENQSKKKGEEQQQVEVKQPKKEENVTKVESIMDYHQEQSPPILQVSLSSTLQVFKVVGGVLEDSTVLKNGCLLHAKRKNVKLTLQQKPQYKVFITSESIVISHNSNVKVKKERKIVDPNAFEAIHKFVVKKLHY